MSFNIFASGMKWELVPGWKYSAGKDSLFFRDGFHARQVLNSILGSQNDLGRLRGFLYDSAGWRDLQNLDNVHLIHRLAQSLHAGLLRLHKQPIVQARPALASAPKTAEPEVEPEVWQEAELTPEPTQAKDAFAVSYREAAALAENNRTLAESGSPFKEHCRNQEDCPVCSAGVNVMKA